MDDRRVGLIIRALRRRRGWRQSDLAAASKLSQPAVSLLERGHLDSLSLRRIRRILAALDARGEFDIRWRGGSLDRTLDEGHAELVGETVAALRAHSWESAVEVTYSIYGERGSIDVLGFHRPTGSLVVIEVKTELTSIEETLRGTTKRYVWPIGLPRNGSVGPLPQPLDFWSCQTRPRRGVRCFDILRFSTQFCLRATSPSGTGSIRLPSRSAGAGSWRLFVRVVLGRY